MLLSNQALLGGPSFSGVNGPPARGTTAFLRMRVCFHTLPPRKNTEKYTAFWFFTIHLLRDRALTHLVQLFVL